MFSMTVIISPSPVHYHDWADEPLSATITRTVNDGISEQVADGAGRLVGLGRRRCTTPGWRSMS